MPPLTEQQLEAHFQDRAISHGGERYYDAATSSAYINLCAENDFAVIGIEGFAEVDHSLMPRMDLIADFSSLSVPSWSEFKDATVSAARRFLAEATSGGLLFSITILSKSEWMTNNS